MKRAQLERLLNIARSSGGLTTTIENAEALGVVPKLVQRAEDAREALESRLREVLAETPE